MEDVKIFKYYPISLNIILHIKMAVPYSVSWFSKRNFDVAQGQK